MPQTSNPPRRLGIVPSLNAAIAIGLVCLFSSPEALARGGKFKLDIVDAETQRPLAARLHLKNVRGRPVLPRESGILWDDHITLDGAVTLNLNTGHYQFELECGPEYKTRSGHFEIKDLADDRQRIEMNRYVDLSREGWWSGDLHVSRPLEEMGLLMRAEDLHLVPLVTRGDKGSRRSPPSARARRPTRSSKPTKTNEAAIVNTKDEANDKTNIAAEGLAAASQEHRILRGGGAMLDDAGGRLLAFHLGENQIARWQPSELMRQLPNLPQRTPRLHLDAPRATSWDLPLWLAADAIDSIGLINSQQMRESVDRPLASDRPPDRVLFPGKHGLGRWAETIYYHVLDCGLRIPPSAGSGSGTGKNPPGYNRVYVFCGDHLSYDSWWDNLRAGRVFVTNGPLLRARAGGELPGHVFRGEAGEQLELQIELTLSTRDRIEYLEVVRDGQIEHEVRLDQWAAAGGRLPPVRFRKSGWFLVRAVTSNEKSYRLASTGPFYVQIGYEPRISKRSARFFLDWLDELEKRRTDSKDARAASNANLDTGTNTDTKGEELATSRAFWRRRLEMANAD